jgi:hypothetical protein
VLETKASAAKVQLSDSRARIWASLSGAADHLQIDAEVLQVDQAKLPAIATLIINNKKVNGHD